MTTSAVTKHFNVVEQVRNGLSMRAITRAMHTLILRAAGEAFHRRIFRATLAAHRATHAVGFQFAKLRSLLPVAQRLRRMFGRRSALAPNAAL